MVGGIIGSGGGLGRPIIFPSEVTGKGCSVIDQAKMIEEGYRGEREAFTEDGSFRGAEKIGSQWEWSRGQHRSWCIGRRSSGKVSISSPRIHQPRTS